ncbi:MAG: hypothetical protein E7012_05975 [Alphaproteobacteria bacterium]|nr:hypothetical protein [Alphaproteobacteria bacterium]
MNKYVISVSILLLSSTSLAQDSCMVRPSCADMGYTKSANDCEGKKAISCPFDTTLFYCPESGFSEYPLETCPDGGVCLELTQYKIDSCQNSYELSSDGLTCNACNFANYPLSTCDANGTCSNYTCGNVTKYKLDSCNSGYTQSGNTCVNNNPCAGYYECGGDWQYCEGYTCSADSDMCSEYCVDDYFLYDCDSESLCDDAWGVYRNGYCSEMCDAGGSSSGGSSSGGSSGDCSACLDMSTCGTGGAWDWDCNCFFYCCDDFWERWSVDNYCNGLIDADEYDACWRNNGSVVGAGPEVGCIE